MVRRGGRGETKMVLPSLSPCCLTSLPAPSSIQGGMSSVLHCPDSLCLWVQWHRALGRRGLRMVQGGDIKDRWGFVFPGPFCCLDWGIWCLLLLWVEWGGSCSYIHIFSIRTVLGSEQIHLCLCPSGLSSFCGVGSTCVAHTRETFPMEPGEGIAEAGGFFPDFPFPRGACYF